MNTHNLIGIVTGPAELYLGDNISITASFCKEPRIKMFEDTLLNRIAVKILSNFKNLTSVQVKFMNYYKQKVIKIVYEENVYRIDELKNISNFIEKEYPKYKFRFYIKKYNYDWKYIKSLMKNK